MSGSRPRSQEGVVVEVTRRYVVKDGGDFGSNDVRLHPVEDDADEAPISLSAFPASQLEEGDEVDITVKLVARTFHVRRTFS